MRFLTRIMGSVPAASHPRQGRRSAGRRRSPIALEMLETRDLLTAVGGVSLTFGNLLIQAPKTSGNVAAVSIDPSTHNVQVTLNGQSEQFAANQVWSITYAGGSGGGDTFTDDVDVPSVEYGFGANNNFTGGSSYNFVFFFGNHNTFNGAAGIYSDVFEIGGSNDSVTENQSNTNVAVYSY